MTGEVVRASLRCDEFAPRAAREFLRQIPDLDWVLGDAMLVASELVTNAVQHSGCTEDDFLTVCVRRESDLLRISVLDPGGTDVAAQIVDRPMAHGGMGLKVVDALSSEWGSTRDDDGHRVWAKLQLAG